MIVVASNIYKWETNNPIRVALAIETINLHFSDVAS